MLEASQLKSWLLLQALVTLVHKRQAMCQNIPLPYSDNGNNYEATFSLEVNAGVIRKPPWDPTTYEHFWLRRFITHFNPKAATSLLQNSPHKKGYYVLPHPFRAQDWKNLDATPGASSWRIAVHAGLSGARKRIRNRRALPPCGYVYIYVWDRSSTRGCRYLWGGRSCYVGEEVFLVSLAATHLSFSLSLYIYIYIYPTEASCHCLQDWAVLERG